MLWLQYDNMPSKETQIWMAIKSRIATLMPSVDKALPAQLPAYEPSADKKYLRVADVSVSPSNVFVASNKPHLRNGILIVTLVHPHNQPDVSIYKDMAGQIAEHFYDGLSMRYLNACVTVDGAPHVQDGYLDNGYWTVPVAINWRCFL